MCRADLKAYLPALSDIALSRQIKHLHVFHLIKRVAGTYMGRAAITACADVIAFTIVPTLASAD